MLSLCPRDLGHETNKGAQRRSEAGGGPMYNFEYQMQHTWIFPEESLSAAIKVGTALIPYLFFDFLITCELPYLNRGDPSLQ